MNKACDPLLKELKKALLLYDRFGSMCLADANLAARMQRYRETIDRTDTAMLEWGVVAACGACAVRTGSCCFEGMDESYGFLSLYTNLLLGSAIPESADFPQSCRFIGKNGCRLRARHSFCLNYFCPDLQAILGKRRLERLHAIIGEQLLAGWEIECYLVRWMADVQRKC